MHATQLSIAAVIVLLAATVQTAVGFGFGLIAVPLLVSAGHSLPDAVALSLGAGLVQTLYGTYTLREHVRWPLAFGLATTQWLFLPAGLAIMALVADAGPTRVKQAVGLLLLALLLSRRFLQPTPRPQIAIGWGLFAGATSGLLSGLSGMGGPPLVLFALAHDWSKEKFRAFLWTQFMLSAPVLAAMLAYRTGSSVWTHAAIGLAFAPLPWLGARLGMTVTARWNATHIARASSVLLYAIALWNLTAPLRHN